MSQDSEVSEVKTKTESQWADVGQILALILVASVPLFIGLAAGGIIVLSNIPQWIQMIYLLLTALAGVKAFGKDALESTLSAWDVIRGKRK